MMKMQMVSAHMERCTTTDSSHSPSSDQTSKRLGSHMDVHGVYGAAVLYAV